MRRVGVLALQGDFQEHIEMLRRLEIETREVRLPEHVQDIDGLIIPGGESTTIGKVAVAYNMIEAIRCLAEAGKPIWGTCAGMILLAKTITREARGGQPLLGLMDISVRRNAYGRQVDSFETNVPIPVLGDKPFHCVFIRAPMIESVGPGVEVLGRIPATGEIVAAKQGKVVVTSFHPELTDDLRFHRYFISLDGEKV